jgi:hypothetical protein
VYITGAQWFVHFFSQISDGVMKKNLGSAPKR